MLSLRSLNRDRHRSRRDNPARINGVGPRPDCTRRSLLSSIIGNGVLCETCPIKFDLKVRAA
jgi:hypothetical protein